MEGLLQFAQQLVSGAAIGCVYGLVALGFVLICKATEVVNFAQVELLMVGAFLAVLCTALFGYLLDRVIVRPIVGQPIFAIIMVLTVALCAVLFLFFRFTKLGIAMQATSRNRLAAYYMGIPVKTVFSLIWGISSVRRSSAGASEPDRNPPKRKTKSLAARVRCQDVAPASRCRRRPSPAVSRGVGPAHQRQPALPRARPAIPWRIFRVPPACSRISTSLPPFPGMIPQFLPFRFSV
jgi:hypothetical protein